MRAHQFDDAVKVRYRLLALTPYILEVVGLAGRHHKVQLVHAQFKSSLGAAVVGNERGHREAGYFQGADRYRLGVHKLGHHLGGHVRRDLNFTHTRLGLCGNPGQLALGGHEDWMNLQAVAQAHFANHNINGGHG